MNGVSEYYSAYVDTGTNTVGDLTTYCPSCWPTNWYSWPTPTENKTERAYEIIKALIAGKIIPEPVSYTAFCELMEAVKKVL